MEPIDHSKIGRRSKRKGKRYESRVAKLLTDFTKVNFRKIPSSGGFNKFGGVVVAKHVFTGDVCCDNSSFKYSVEAKNRQDINIATIIKNPSTSPLSKYWYQCVEDANSNNKKPIMFFKPNNQSDFICISQKDDVYDKLKNSNHLCVNVYNSPVFMSVIARGSKGQKLGVSSKDVSLPNFIIIDWELFIKYVVPQDLFENILLG